MEHSLARFLVLHQQVLHGGAQGCFQSQGVPGGNPEQLAHRAENPGEFPRLDGVHGGFDPLGVALVVLGHLLQEGLSGGQGVGLHPLDHPGLFRLGLTPLAAGQVLLALAEGFRLVPAGLGLGFLGLAQVRLGLG